MTTALIAWSTQHAGVRSEPVPYRSDTAVQAAAPGGWSSSPPSPKRRSSGPHARTRGHFNGGRRAEPTTVLTASCRSRPPIPR